MSVSPYIKLYGNRINLNDIEIRLKKAFYGYDFLCKKEDDKLIIITDHDDVKILEYVSKYLSMSKSVFCIRNVEKIPRKENGKPDYDFMQH